MSLCTYCGNYDGNELDHVIPSSYTSVVKNYAVGQLVPSCKECNVNLSDKMYITVPKRAAYLYQIYSIKYKKEKSFPDWTLEELLSVSENLQRQIKINLLKRDIIEERLEKLYLVSLGFDIFTEDMNNLEAIQRSDQNMGYTEPEVEVEYKQQKTTNQIKISSSGITVHTPLGTFKNFSLAAKAHNVPVNIIRNLCVNDTENYWAE